MPSYITDKGQEKAALRKELRGQLAACPPQEMAQRDRCLTQRFLQLPQVAQAKTVLLYYGVGVEPDTRPLTEALWDMGKTVAMPLCLEDCRMEARVVRCWEDLTGGKFGIPEPKQNCTLLAKEQLDLILVPALACDREGYRLGQGAGFYDRYLSDYRGVTVALCGDNARIEQLPREAHDLPVSVVITETDP
jgi:5-formyltetrahydrofolate cyclo-ligase